MSVTNIAGNLPGGTPAPNSAPPGPSTGGSSGGSGVVTMPRAFFGGHSYVAGYQNLEGGERFATRAAAMLDAEEVTYAQTSAVVAQDDSQGHPGGYASILNGLRPRSFTPFAMADRTAQPYLPLSPLVVLCHGFNDLAFLAAATATNVAWVQMALRALICVGRLGGIFADTHASVAYGGSGGSHWTAHAAQTAFGSPTNHQTTTVADTVTITVPADFPGGEIDVFTLALSGGSRWSAVVDGGAPQILDGTASAYGSAAGRANLVVQRFPGLTPGAHTIALTVTAIDPGASAVFDSWGIAAPEVPLTLLMTQPSGAPALPYANAGAAHTPITAADVLALNVAIAALALEFDSMVRVADLAAYFAAAGGNVPYTSPGSLFFSDNLHPNSAGHAVAAQCVVDAVAAAPLVSGVVRAAASASVQRQVLAFGAAGAWPNGGEPALFSAAWAKAANVPNCFKRLRDNRVELTLQLVRTGAPVLSETILLLPPGYAPSGEVLLQTLSWNGAFSAATTGLCAVRNTGSVVWYSGDPTTLFEINGSWLADGLAF